MAEIKLLITDFDGTLVNTFEANYLAYQKAFETYNLQLNREMYQACFGLRFDAFMDRAGILNESIQKGIRELKSSFYPDFFDRLIVNQPLLLMLRSFKQAGGLTAVASTARLKNLMNALSYIHATDVFSLILAGEDVKQGKPDPEIYNTVLNRLHILPEEALVFEDSSVGMKAAEAAGIAYVKVTNTYFYEDSSERS